MSTGKLDKELYPLLAEYLAAVPGGIYAYSRVLTRSDYSIALRLVMGDVLTATTLPALIQDRLTATWAPNEWIPACNYVMLSALCRDRVWRTEEEYHRGMFNIANDMYRLPLHRALMRVLSPTLIVMGAAKRWHNFHKGTTLEAQAVGKHRATIKLTFPDRLFHPVCLKSLGATFCAAVAGAGAANPNAAIAAADATTAVWDLTWDAK